MSVAPTERVREETSAPGSGPVERLDVRALGPPKPLTETIERLTEMDEGVLIQLNDRIPQHLFPKLDERGYAYETIEIDGVLVTAIWDE